MYDVRVIIIYTNKLESVSVDGDKMEGVSAIEDKPISEWFSPSEGRDGWEGLIPEIKSFIDDDEANLKFEFCGAQEYKNTFEKYLKKYGLDCSANAITAEEVNRRNMKTALKQEHKGLYNEAFKLYLSAANSGSAEAQYKVAEYYFSIYNGENNSMEISPKKAISEAANYYQEAANQNHVDSQMRLYEILYNGIGVDRDTDSAVRWLTKAAKNGNYEAKAELDKLSMYSNTSYNTEVKKRKNEEVYSGYKKTDTSVKKVSSEIYKNETPSYYDKNTAYNPVNINRANPSNSEEAKLISLANKGDAEAQNKLGEFYLRAKNKDVNKAVYWLEKAAKQKYLPAITNLGDVHRFEKKTDDFIKYYTEAANAGDIRAQYRLNECYYYGIGVKKDEDKSVEWFRKASTAEDKASKNIVDYNDDIYQNYLVNEMREHDKWQKEFDDKPKNRKKRSQKDYEELERKIRAFDDEELEKLFEEFGDDDISDEELEKFFEEFGNDDISDEELEKFFEEFGDDISDEELDKFLDEYGDDYTEDDVKKFFGY